MPPCLLQTQSLPGEFLHAYRAPSILHITLNTLLLHICVAGGKSRKPRTDTTPRNLELRWTPGPSVTRTKLMGQVLCNSAVQYSPDYRDTPWIGPWHPYCMHLCLSPVSLPISPSNCFWQCFMLSRRNYILSPPEMQSRFMSKDMTLMSSTESMFAQGLIKSAPTNYCTLYNSCNAQWHLQ